MVHHDGPPGLSMPKELLQQISLTFFSSLIAVPLVLLLSQFIVWKH